MMVGLNRLLLTCAMVLIALPVKAAAPEASCPIVPTPKVYRDTGGTARLLGPESAAIVLGEKAAAPERYAAERLQSLIERRFKQRLPVLGEREVGPGVRQALILGRRATNGWLDKLCLERRIELGPASPPEDGFVIECLEDAGRQVVLIGAGNERGVVYGQDAFFDLLRCEGGEIVFPLVSVRDWPSIAWRGRPHSCLLQHLVPGVFDAYMRARLNFTDVRDDLAVKGAIESPARKASMGFYAGAAMDEASVRQVLDGAHRRGMFVYGVVACAVKPEKFDAVIKTYEQLIALGVDGLWVSFDDLGPGSRTAALIPRILELGKRHEMTGRRIAITPPLKSYQTIDTEFNRSTAAIPDFCKALWFFTRVPCREDLETARRIGFALPPAWWHNLVGFQGGFTYTATIAFGLRAGDKPGYMEIQPLTMGWGSPKYDRIRDADKYTDTVMLWGLLSGWPEEYELGALGIWAWNPARHDWTRTRKAIYSHVFGPSQADAAYAFDDKLAQLKTLFHLPLRHFQPNKGWPCRLKRIEDRSDALKRIEEMDALLKAIESGAPLESSLDPARLATTYLEPMRATLTCARKMTQLDYPECRLDDLEGEMCSLVAQGRMAAAEQALAKARKDVLEQVQRVEQELQGLNGIREYASFWRDRVSGVEYWKKLSAQRRATMETRFKKVMREDPEALFPRKKPAGGDMKSLLEKIADAPPGAPLVEISAKDWLRTPPTWRGAWGLGAYEADGRAVVAIAYPPQVPSEIGDFAEVRAEVPLPAFQGRLLLDAFVNDTRLDNAWRGYRFMQLWVNDSLAWEEDIAPSREGREWITVDVTEAARAAGRLSLRFRVVDKRAVSTHATVTFIGPVRLRTQAAP